MSYLEYQDEMYLNALNEDACLVIASRGIGLEQLMVRLCRAYSDNSNLVLVVGTDPSDEAFFVNQLINEPELPIGKLPQCITAESSNAKKRSDIYQAGGVLFVTTRILVVDLLMDRVPVDLITGIIVYKAHKVINDCLLCFILRLYRMNNKKGFIKALSQNPQSFLGGYGRLDKVMRSLFATSLQLWPRFHATIQSSLNLPRSPPNVIEIRLDLSDNMKKIQFAIMDLIDLCLKELSKTNTAFLYDSDQLTAENAISKGFDNFVKKRFDEIWHQLSSRAKRLLNDIQWLRSLLWHLTQSDAVAFYNQTRSAQNSIRVGNDVSDWIFWKPAEQLFVLSKQRLYPNGSQEPDFESETNQKWKAFNDMIEEIDKETESVLDTVHVIVIVANDGVSRLLTSILEKGATTILKERFQRFNAIIRGNLSYIDNLDEEEEQSETKATEEKDGTVKMKKKYNKKRVLGAEQMLPDDTVTLTQIVRNMTKNQNSNGEPEIVTLEEASNIEPMKFHQLKLHYFSLRDRYIVLESLLNTYKPMHVVLYDLDMHAIRQLEVYQAVHCHPEQCKIYFFIFDRSAEEQQYLSSLRKEKEAFEFLIKEKSTMVIPSGRDGKTDGHPDLIRGNDKANETTESVNTRKAGGQQIDRASIIMQKVLVDMREFRSDLPSIVHKRGIEIEPIQLEIGDYILAPDTCVERKSISDLIQSLQSGRLYNQATMMIRHFKRSILLIEFDETKSFHFKGRYWGIGGDNFRSKERRFDLIDRLILLTIHHNNLKLVWSPSTHFTAELFEYLKLDRPQPEAERILAISSQELPPETFEDRYDLQVREFLLRLPGVNSHNVYSIMNKINCLADLVDLAVEELTEILGNSKSADLFYQTLHASMTKLVGDAISAEQESKKSRLFNCMKKRKTHN